MSLLADGSRPTADDPTILTNQEVKTALDGCLETPSVAEHRGSNRRDFPVMQWMVPCDGHTMPDKKRFVVHPTKAYLDSWIARILSRRNS
jgi:hypothetical protein